MELCCLKVRESESTEIIIQHISNKRGEVDEGYASAAREVLLSNLNRERVWTRIADISQVAAIALTCAAVVAVIAIAILIPPFGVITATLAVEGVGLGALVTYYLTSRRAPKKLERALKQSSEDDTIRQLALGVDFFTPFYISKEGRCQPLTLFKRKSKTGIEWLAEAGKVKALTYCMLVLHPKKRAANADRLLKLNDLSHGVKTLLTQFLA